MYKRIFTFLKHPTSKNVIINTLGNYVNIFFTAFFALVLVRILDPARYGVLSVLLGIAYVLANLLDFGTTATIYSYLPSLIKAKTVKMYRFLKSTFFYQLLFSSAVILFLFISFPTLDRIFFKTSAPLWELYLTTFAVLFLIWQNFALNALFAAKKFFEANLFINAANIFKTLLLFLFIEFHLISVGVVIFVFGIAGPAVFFSLLLLRKKYVVLQIIRAPIKRSDFRFSYTLTYFVASQFFNLGLRMDLFLLSFYKLRQDVGYYGLAQKIILTIIASVGSITQVLSPRFSNLIDLRGVKREIKKAFVYLLIPTFLFLLLSIVPDKVFYIVFTKKFALTATLTKELARAYLIYPLSTIPFLFTLYTIKKPVFILGGNILFFITITAGAYFFIPKFGVFCLPYIIFFAFFIAGFVVTFLSFLYNKEIKSSKIS